MSAQSVAELGPRLVAAAEAAGLETAKQVVVVSDGAPWIRGLVEQFIPQATLKRGWPQFVHHLTDCGKTVPGVDDPLLPLWVATTTRLVWAEGVTRPCEEVAALLQMAELDKVPVHNLLHYLDSNRDRVAYPQSSIVWDFLSAAESSRVRSNTYCKSKVNDPVDDGPLSVVTEWLDHVLHGEPHGLPFTTRLREARRALMGT